jgi:hypothetical protein
MTHAVYGLAFVIEDEPIIFYVGHTNNVERRTHEHANNPFNPNHSEYNTMKYRWCRQLHESQLSYDLFVIREDPEEDEDSEYAVILDVARDNQERGITFFDNLPLTNMKAGDFITEMLDAGVQGAKGVEIFKKIRAVSKIAVTYQREDLGTGEFTAQGQLHINQAHQIAEESAAREKYAKSKKITRTVNTMSEEAVRKANSLLLKRELDEGCMLWEEYNAEMQRIGYPEWTETRPQLVNKFN